MLTDDLAHLRALCEAACAALERSAARIGQAERFESASERRADAAALGAYGQAVRPDVVRGLIGAVPAMCFGTTKDGSPKHPLYLRADAPLIPWSPR